MIGAGLLYQFVLCLAALMAAEAVGLTDLGLTPLLAFFPAVLIAQVLPIGISGLGVREGAFVIFLTPLGVPAEQAVALGLLLYLLNLVASLLGCTRLRGRRARCSSRRLTEAPACVEPAESEGYREPRIRSSRPSTPPLTSRRSTTASSTCSPPRFVN